MAGRGGWHSKLTRELQRLGHKRIAFVNNHLRWDSVVEDHYSSGERRRGYVEAMAAAGRRPRLVEQIYLAAPVLDASDSLIRHHGLMPPWGGPGDDRIARAIALLRSDDRPTAVVCPNADSAGPMLVAAGILGLSVPGELSVCCVEFDIPCVHGHRTTTGIIPFYECGLAAIARLDERMAGKRPSRGVAVPYVRFEGTTIGPLSTS